MDFSKESNDKKKKSINSKNKKVKNRFGVIMFRILFIFFIFTIFAAIGGGLGIFLGIINTAPDIEDINLNPEKFTSIIYDLNGNEIDRLHGNENRIYVTLDEIPLHLQHAFIAIEDERFYEHNGIDLKGIFRAIIVNIKNMDFSEGASTITQQLIKNRILTNEKTIERKLQEQYLAVQLEKKYDKDQILEWYLNEIGLGHGLNGVQAAANTYFNKDVSELTLAESAVIAAITQNPSKYSPIRFPENNRERQQTVLEKMLEQGYITQSEYDEAIKEDVYSKIQETSQQSIGDSKHSYYVDQIIEDVINDLQEKKGYTATEASNLIYNGGLSIYTPFNQEMQDIVDKYYNNDEFYPPNSFELKVIYNLSVKQSDGSEKHFGGEGIIPNEDAIEEFKKQKKEDWGISEDAEITQETCYTIPQPQSAMVIMDYHNGHVLAISGGRGEKIGNLMFNRATHAKRQPGSAFKILAAYAPALDTGKITPATVIDDVPLKVKNGSSYKWINNWNGQYAGLTTVREGIYNSMNILAVKTLLNVGIDTAFDYLQNFGFTTLIDYEERNGVAYTDKNPVLALGGLTDGVTPLELTAAYGAIANNGVYIEPVFYTKVLDHEGNLLIDNTPEQHRVLKETTAFLLTDMMEDVITEPTGTGRLAKFNNIKNMPIAGKTGTTSDNKDLVFVGYTPYYVAGIWLGHDTPKPLIYDRSYHNMLWSAIMEEIHKDLPIKQFEVPSGIVKARICTESGKLATSNCEEDPRGATIRYEYFEQGTQPTEYCDVHVKEKICTVSGKLSNEYCPEETVKEKVFIVRPEPYIPPSENGPFPQDTKYELPSGEDAYCDIHGPDTIIDDDDFTIPEADEDGNIFIPFERGTSDSDLDDFESDDSDSNLDDFEPDNPDSDTPDSSIVDTPDSMDDFFVPLP
ncbi:transglycosylase domain-containing protein [Defluviitalea phaphyphila]|uniref:transglycosylase domain-containing protein n=1 Tax=Defluviitalea phaphyphila TaxID=1473580 RepID=UPI00072FF6FB|nr:PBP1A family penicillin-binding protein [Defluviitalea phaphyphila]